MGKKTPLYDCHVAANAKIVDFAGWDMPLHYGSQLQEHHHVRQSAGIFDVSHMTIVDLNGTTASLFLRKLVANNVDKLTPGKALYTCMLNEQGGVIDDLIIYKNSVTDYRLIVNSATHDKDLNWIKQQAIEFNVTITERIDLAMVALQGPAIKEKIATLFSPTVLSNMLALKPFHFLIANDFFIARTGYTGEDGFEIILPSKTAPSFWDQSLKSTIAPCGLGARDTLRLEAGLNLYGADMDETVTPLESNLAWTISWEPHERDFIGRTALEHQKQAGVQKQLVGLVLETQGVLRNHQRVIVENDGIGEITSGSFSPTLSKGIALARIPAGNKTHCFVEMRGKQVAARIVKPPFVRQGKQNF